MFQELSTKKVLILGCGNVLMGDDGFGPAVIKKLTQECSLPDWAHAEDVGTSVRDILFNIALMDERPEHLIVLDAVQRSGREAGEVFEIAVDEIPEKKLADYSFHQFPTTNMLREIKDQCGIRVTIIAAQVSGEPSEVRPGLSRPMHAAVQKAAQKVMRTVV